MCQALHTQVLRLNSPSVITWKTILPWWFSRADIFMANFPKYIFRNIFFWDSTVNLNSIYILSITVLFHLAHGNRYKRGCNKRHCQLTYDLLLLLIQFYFTFYLYSTEISPAVPNSFDLKSARRISAQKQIAIYVSKPDECLFSLLQEVKGVFLAFPTK